MKAFLRPWLLATLIGAGLPLVAQADVWGYVDDQGMTHFAESQLDSRYKLYFKNENFDFDPRKSALAQKQQRRPGPAGSGLTFNPSADAAAGNKAIRLVSQINRSRSYSQVSRHIQREASRNFPNRLGKNSNVYLGSAELAAICSKLGRIPTKAEYLADMGVLTKDSDKIYQYLNFDQVKDYTDLADTVKDSVAA